MTGKNDHVKDELKWKKFPLLNDGFVCLVDCMGDDSDVIQAARVSYGKDLREPKTEEDLHIINGLNKSDTGLLRYLMRHRHTTPFEMVEVKMLIRIPMDAWRQMVRHRTANINEYSTRYTEAIDSRQTTEPDAWRLQSKSNKQGSSGDVVTEWPENYKNSVNTEYPPGKHLSDKEFMFHQEAMELYEERLKFGVAKEVARKDLPLSTYTEAYWKCDLHNIFHFLGLRMDSHAQKEIRDYATTIGEQIIKPLFPVSYQAFMDYRFKAITLSALDQAMIQDYIYWNAGDGNPTESDFYSYAYTIFGGLPKTAPTREAVECFEKCKRLGLIKEFIE